MTDLFENPMGLDGFEFVEFSGPEPELFHKVFTALGFSPVAKHRSKAVTLYRQGDINFILNEEPRTRAAFFAEEHGPGACGMAFRVKDAQYAYNRAIELGAEPVDVEVSPMELKLPAVRGIGGALLYLIDRYEPGSSIYDIDFRFQEGADLNPAGVGLEVIDHLTHNVYRGRMDYWAKYYEELFGFRQIRFFDIQGQHTGLVSRAMSAPDGKIRIPLNEEASREAGQIEEFLLEFNGEGIQHIALHTSDIFATVDALRESGVPMMSAPPQTYYEMLEDRLPGHGETVGEMHTRGVLLDGTMEGGERKLLLQIFTDTMVGPVFFEIIQRKGDEGFGEGNFQALFESIERDQIRRGVLKTDGQ
ncbi:MAG: 4-hydroxyphenylpyruvate dioxygenase [Myxococcota bacterium]|nr:4-hydroxyphenylpyruvate dioxygenase [Myxococcota bacterium]